jgi:hypothetical protein
MCEQNFSGGLVMVPGKQGRAGTGMIVRLFVDDCSLKAVDSGDSAVQNRM